MPEGKEPSGSDGREPSGRSALGKSGMCGKSGIWGMLGRSGSAGKPLWSSSDFLSCSLPGTSEGWYPNGP